jgi:pilus assembly protein Flp/PilA
MSKFIASYLRDESGAAAAEYALILAIVCTGIAAAVLLLGTNISTAVSTAATKV